MKLLIVLSVIACGYAAKLDRTYLPPASAGTSGGSPGSLNTPLGPSGFGQPAGFGQSGFNGAGQTGSAFRQSGQNGLGVQPNQYQAGSGQENFDAGFGAPAQNFGNQPQRAQASAEQAAEILRSDSQNDGETFSYSFETSNGISAEESGVATNGVQAQGAFAYSGDDGQTYRVQYTADENGYQPQGEHLPTSPPIPEEILKSIEENARAAAAGTQEGAYNPDEDNNEVPQQYNNNAPTSYNQAPTGQNTFKQAGNSPAQLYGAPNGGSRPLEPQGPQQYNAGSGAPNGNSARPSNGFGSQGNSPSQLYGSPSNGAGNGASRPNGFNQQGPSQQYPTGPSGASNFATSGSQARPQQYQASPTGQFPSAGRPQGSSQAQDASGYQYNKPQGGFGGNSNNGPTQQYRPQNEASAGPQGYSRPSGNAFPSSDSNSQGSFGASLNSQGSFGSAPTSNSQGSFTPSGTNGPSGPKSPSSFGSNGQSSYGSPARPNSAFGATSSSQPSAPNGFSRPQTGPNGQGFNRPQGQAPGAKSPMSGSGYEYNQPSGNSQFGSAPSQNGNAQFGGSQNGFNSAGQGRPGQFGAPRAPPSFNEEEGYKY